MLICKAYPEVTTYIAQSKRKKSKEPSPVRTELFIFIFSFKVKLLGKTLLRFREGFQLQHSLSMMQLCEDVKYGHHSQ